MKTLYTILILAALFRDAATAQSTQERKIVTTSALWRQILTNEDAAASLNLLSTNLYQEILSNLISGGSGVAIEDGYQLAPTLQGTPSNTYWLDGGKTNSEGLRLIYADLTPTNDAYFAGITNFKYGTLLSLGILANATRAVEFPTNLFLGTNGTMLLTNYPVVLTNSMAVITLSNKSYLRFTIRSNANGLEPQLAIKP